MVVMGAALRSIFSDQPRSFRGGVIGLYALIAVMNLVAWGWALVAFRAYPVLLGTAFLAYGFGLRHAVDADHIAAIDNATRKLMQAKKQPIALGFFFALGHSTVVLLAAIGVALTAGWLRSRFPHLQQVGGLIGTGISAAFLLLVAIANLYILAAVWRRFRAVRRGDDAAAEDVGDLLPQGLLGRLFRPLFSLVGKSWHLYGIGFLFGLGFDTATEIGLLGIAAAESARGLSVWATLVFPMLFTAGMTLVDSTDSVLMVGAYGWAFTKPVRKLYYNLTITFVSVVVAVLVGGVEALGLVVAKLSLTGPFWTLIADLNENFGRLGYLIIAIFALSWLASAIVYRWKRYGEIEGEV
jgi:nickel/cobalt transporter (NiCoT) family protein